jgi:hypothetical protein
VHEAGCRGARGGAGEGGGTRRPEPPDHRTRAVQPGRNLTSAEGASSCPHRTPRSSSPSSPSPSPYPPPPPPCPCPCPYPGVLTEVVEEVIVYVPRHLPEVWCWVLERNPPRGPGSSQSAVTIVVWLDPRPGPWVLPVDPRPPGGADRRSRGENGVQALKNARKCMICECISMFGGPQGTGHWVCATLENSP